MKLRHGVTLLELMVTIVILAILGTGLTRLMTAQVRFYEHQGAAAPHGRSRARPSTCC